MADIHRTYSRDRWSLAGLAGVTGAFLVAVGLLVSGAFYFRRMEKTFADVV